MRVILDTGALVALERNDRAMWAALKTAVTDEFDVLVPSTVLAQAWRGGRRQALLALALDQCEIAPFDPMAREIGALCGKAGSRDICDAHVALLAVGCDVLYTSDPEDLRMLLTVCGREIPTIVRC